MKKNKFRRCLRALCVLIPVLLTHCSDPRKPTVENFSTALERFLKDENFCISAGGKIPHVELVAARWPWWRALVDAGLLKEESVIENVDVKSDSFMARSQGTLKVAVKRYDFTERGQSISHAASWGDSTEFCFGSYTPENVQAKTPPMKTPFGFDVVRVAYTKRLIDVPQWFIEAKEKLFLVNPKIKDSYESALNGDKASLELAQGKKGWVTPKDAKTMLTE